MRGHPSRGLAGRLSSWPRVSDIPPRLEIGLVETDRCHALELPYPTPPPAAHPGRAYLGTEGSGRLRQWGQGEELGSGGCGSALMPWAVVGGSGQERNLVGFPVQDRFHQADSAWGMGGEVDWTESGPRQDLNLGTEGKSHLAREELMIGMRPGVGVWSEGTRRGRGWSRPSLLVLPRFLPNGVATTSRTAATDPSQLPRGHPWLRPGCLLAATPSLCPLSIVLHSLIRAGVAQPLLHGTAAGELAQGTGGARGQPGLRSFKSPFLPAWFQCVPKG